MAMLRGLLGALPRPGRWLSVQLLLLLLGALALGQQPPPGLPASCLEARDAYNVTASGLQQIETRETSTRLSVQCDMSRLGGGWTRVFHHDYRAKAKLSGFKQVDANVDSPGATLYSILSLLSELRTANGPFEFLMEWPGSQFTRPQVWMQYGLPFSTPPEHVTLVSAPYMAKGFAGLHYSDRFQATLDASSESWAYAVMQSREWDGGLFGPGAAVPQASLWVRAVACHATCATCSGPTNTDCLSCSRHNEAVSAGGVCLPTPNLGNTTIIYDSCLDLHAAQPSLKSGQYIIALRSTGQILPVVCDMARLGGGWTRVFHHDYRAADVLATFKQMDADTMQPRAKLYAILSKLDEFRQANGPFEFLMEWPGSQFSKPQVWRQFGLGADTPPLQAVSTPYTAKGFVGLTRSDRFQATLDASSRSWAYAVMQSRAWGGGLFGPGAAVPQASLWVRAVDCHPSCRTCIGPTNTDCLSCSGSTVKLTSQGTCAADDSIGLPSSCKTLDANSPDGIYTIFTGDRVRLNVTCDMSRRGGGWTRLFHHDYSNKTALSGFKQVDANVDTPDGQLYSIVSHLDGFRIDGGPLEFLMEWPGSRFTRPQIWRQLDVPVRVPPQHMVGVEIPYPGRAPNVFAGLHFSDRFQATLDASSESWAFAVMQSREWGGGLFGPGTAVPQASLWVRGIRCQAVCRTCIGPTTSDCLSCRDAAFLPQHQCAATTPSPATTAIAGTTLSTVPASTTTTREPSATTDVDGCLLQCPLQDEPVCSNGLTYPSPCHARCLGVPFIGGACATRRPSQPTTPQDGLTVTTTHTAAVTTEEGPIATTNDGVGVGVDKDGETGSGSGSGSGSGVEPGPGSGSGSGVEPEPGSGSGYGSGSGEGPTTEEVLLDTTGGVAVGIDPSTTSGATGRATPTTPAALATTRSAATSTTFTATATTTATTAFVAQLEISSYNTVRELSSDFSLAWNCNATHIEALALAWTDGYVGVGFNPSGGGMAGADIVIGQIGEATGPVITDRFSSRRGVPALDASDDLLTRMGSREGSLVRMAFSRLRMTGDTAQDRDVQSGPMQVIWALGNTNSLSYHRARGQIDIDICPTQTTSRGSPSTATTTTTTAGAVTATPVPSTESTSTPTTITTTTMTTATTVTTMTTAPTTSTSTTTTTTTSTSTSTSTSTTTTTVPISTTSTATMTTTTTTTTPMAALGLQYYNSTQVLSPDLTLAWNCNATHIEALVVAQTDGYVGVGFNPSGGGMAGADIVIGQIGEATGPVITDRFSSRRGVPALDASDDLLTRMGSREGSLVRMAFSRLRTTGDTVQDRDVQSGPMQVIWALGNTNSLSYHRARGQIDIELHPIEATTSATGSVSTSAATATATTTTTTLVDTTMPTTSTSTMTTAPTTSTSTTTTTTTSTSTSTSTSTTTTTVPISTTSTATMTTTTTTTTPMAALGLQYYNSTQVLSPDLTLAWNCNATHIEALVVAQTDGYVGVGFNPSGGGMAGADIVIGQIGEATGPVITDRFSSRRGVPALDASDDLLTRMGSREGSLVRMAFSRLRTTGDAAQDRDVQSGPMQVIWALGNTNSLSYHRARGQIDIELHPIEATTSATGSVSTSAATATATTTTTTLVDTTMPTTSTSTMTTAPTTSTSTTTTTTTSTSTSTSTSTTTTTVPISTTSTATMTTTTTTTTPMAALGLQYYNSTQVLSPDLTLAWNCNATHIEALVVAQTDGYVGVGFNPSGGGMAGADIVIGQIGEATGPVITDRFSSRRGVPALDASDDLLTRMGSREGSLVRMAFSRLRTTGDTVQDRDVQSGPMQVIWALGRTTSLSYHRVRGEGSIELCPLPSTTSSTTTTTTTTRATTTTTTAVPTEAQIMTLMFDHDLTLLSQHEMEEAMKDILRNPPHSLSAAELQAVRVERDGALARVTFGSAAAKDRVEEVVDLEGLRMIVNGVTYRARVQATTTVALPQATADPRGAQGGSGGGGGGGSAMMAVIAVLVIFIILILVLAVVLWRKKSGDSGFYEVNESGSGADFVDDDVDAGGHSQI